MTYYHQLAQAKEKITYKRFRLTLYAPNSGNPVPSISEVCKVANELADFANSQHPTKSRQVVKLASVLSCGYNVTEISKNGYGHVPVMSTGRRAIAAIEYQSALSAQVFEHLKHWYWIAIGAVTIQVVEVEDLLNRNQ